jgi:hypothetical protein
LGTGSFVKSTIDVDGEDQLHSDVDNNEDFMDNTLDISEESDKMMVSKTWLTVFYAVDIVEGFKFISEMATFGSIIEDAFGIQYEGISYVKTTYNDHLC